MVKVQEHPLGAVVFVKVVPNASRDEVVGALGDQLKVKVSKPPEGGKANAAVVQLLANALGVAAGSVEVLSGHGRPQKQVLIRGVSAGLLRERVGKVLEA